MNSTTFPIVFIGGAWLIVVGLACFSEWYLKGKK